MEKKIADHKCSGAFAAQYNRWRSCCCQSIQEMMSYETQFRTSRIKADPENQLQVFRRGLPESAKLVVKSGTDKSVRHDAAYIEVPGLRPYLLVVFTEGKRIAE